MTEPRDRELSRIYREAQAPEPPQRIDDAILAASRRAAGSRPRAAGTELVRRSSAPIALAATVLLTFTVTLMVFQELPEPDSAQVLMQPGTADARAEKPAQAESTPPKTIPQRESRRDAKVEPPTSSSERTGARRPAFVPDPRGAAGQTRESEPVRAATRPAAPAPAASSRLETAAGRVVADEAKERSPEKWLEDIRKLKSQGKTPEAEHELAEFKKRYPDYRLPEDLR